MSAVDSRGQTVVVGVDVATTVVLGEVATVVVDVEVGAVMTTVAVGRGYLLEQTLTAGV